MRRVVIVLYRDFPWYSGLSDRVLGISKELCRLGLRVKVIAPLIHGYEEVNYSNLEVERVRIMRIKIGVRFLRKLLSLISWLYYILRCFIKVLRNSGNIDAVQFEHYYTFPIAYLSRALLRKPVIADDVNLVHFRPLPKLFRKIFYIIETKMLKTSVLVTTASPLTLAYIRRFFPNTRVLYLPNAVGAIPKYRIADKRKWIVFVGNLGFKQNVNAVRNILRISEKLARIRDDFKVIIIGSYMENAGQLLNHSLVKKGIVRFLGSLPTKLLDYVLSRAAIALLPFFGLPRWGGQMTKTLKLMSYGLCVVSSPEAVKWVKGIKPGIHYVLVNDIDECVKALDRLLSNIEECVKIGMRSREVIMKYHTWRTVCSAYAYIISKL